MAALVDSSIPEITRQLSDPAEVEIEPDVVVKSKPVPGLVTSSLLEQEKVVEPDVIVKSKPRPIDIEQDQGEPAIIEVSQVHAEIDQVDRTQQPESKTVSSVTSEIPTALTKQKKANGDIGLNKTVAPSQVSAEKIEQVDVKKKEAFDDSTAMLLRRYTGLKSGREGHIPITSTGEIGGTIPLTETFHVAGKSCTVRLEEDYISWITNGRKDGEFVHVQNIHDMLCTMVHGFPCTCTCTLLSVQ